MINLENDKLYLWNVTYVPERTFVSMNRRAPGKKLFLSKIIYTNYCIYRITYKNVRRKK